MEKTEKTKELRGALLLTLTALIWGTAFVAQSMGMDYLEPFTFNGIRTLVGGIVLLPIIWALDKNKKKNPGIKKEETENRIYIKGGIICGIVLFIASSLQQIGIQYTTAGKAGFLTALYIVIVPVIGLFMKKKVGIKIWVSVVIAVAGAYLLSVKEGFSIGIGDTYVLLCAVAFSFHIIFCDKYSSLTDAAKLSCTQFFTSGTISVLVALFAEKPELHNILMSWGPILYTGVMSCGVAYTLQIVGQKSTPPAIASLIMSLESVFSALAGWLILGEKLSLKELLGCVLVFTAVILTQLPPLTKRAEEKV